MSRRVAVVTGGAQGLGAATCRRLAAEGLDVVAVDVQATAGGIVLDVCDPVAVGHAFAELERVDVLVCAAGVIRDGTIENLTDADYEAVVDVSLRGTFNCCRVAVPGMKAQRFGRIVTFASIAYDGNYGQTNYAAAKAGIVGLTRSLALETGPNGVTANVVSPGLIDTPMLASMKASVRERMVKAIPAGRVGDPDEIAATVAFLVGDGAGYINGAVIPVDGGLSVGIPMRT